MKLAISCLLALMMAACVVPEQAIRPVTYDFGELPPVPLGGEAKRPVLVLDEVQAPSSLDSNHILYRLRFANGQELMPYANSRWTMPPAQIFMQRMKNRLGRDVAVASPAEMAGAPALRVELDTFEQVFVNKENSRGLVRLRASLIRNRQLLAQRYFSAEHAAATADAPGGVQALTQATDAVLDDLARWLQTEVVGNP